MWAYFREMEPRTPGWRPPRCTSFDGYQLDDVLRVEIEGWAQGRPGGVQCPGRPAGWKVARSAQALGVEKGLHVAHHDRGTVRPQHDPVDKIRGLQVKWLLGMVWIRVSANWRVIAKSDSTLEMDAVCILI